MAPHSQEVVEIAIAAKDYRDFLRKVLSQVKRRSKLSVSAISQRAGFRSRSFIKEVIDGKKRLSEASARQLSRALNLTSSVEAHFKLMVLLENSLSAERKVETTALQEKVRRSRLKLARSLSRATLNPTLVSPLISDHLVLEVYAALGTPESGATIEQIRRRTKLPVETCTQILERLLKLAIARQEGARFFPESSHLAIAELGRNVNFQKIFLGSLLDAKKIAEKKFESEEDLFFHSVFSIQCRRLPELKQRLREMLHEFVDEALDDDGDRIGKLVLAFYS